MVIPTVTITEMQQHTHISVPIVPSVPLVDLQLNHDDNSNNSNSQKQCQSHPSQCQYTYQSEIFSNSNNNNKKKKNKSTQNVTHNKYQTTFMSPLNKKDKNNEKKKKKDDNINCVNSINSINNINNINNNSNSSSWFLNDIDWNLINSTIDSDSTTNIKDDTMSVSSIFSSYSTNTIGSWSSSNNIINNNNNKNNNYQLSLNPLNYTYFNRNLSPGLTSISTDSNDTTPSITSESGNNITISNENKSLPPDVQCPLCNQWIERDKNVTLRHRKLCQINLFREDNIKSMCLHMLYTIRMLGCSFVFSFFIFIFIFFYCFFSCDSARIFSRTFFCFLFGLVGFVGNVFTNSVSMFKMFGIS